MPRILRLEPAAVGAVLALLYAAAAMLYRAFVAKDLAVIDWDILGAAISAGYLLFVRGQVTPVDAPKNTEGRPLIPDPYS
jgi:hypothetical protein